MGSPSTAERPASAPNRLRFTIGPGPLSGGSKLNMLRPHGPEKSGMGAAVPAALAGTMTAVKRAAAIRLLNRTLALECGMAQAGSMPRLRNTAAAAGEVRNLTSALAASVS